MCGPLVSIVSTDDILYCTPGGRGTSIASTHTLSLQHLQGKWSHLQSCALEEVSVTDRKHHSSPNITLASDSVPLYSPLNDRMEMRFFRQKHGQVR